jgi:hypothetical protein
MRRGIQKGDRANLKGTARTGSNQRIRKKREKRRTNT